MDDIIIAALIGVVGTLICVYIGYLLSSQTSKNTIRQQEFSKAASDFHAAFIEVQRRLDESKSFDILKTDGEGVRDILRKSITKHERAKIRFRPYISKCKLICFVEAWEAYYSQENRNSECLSEYQSKFHHNTKDPKHEGEVRKSALSRIEKLLSFTETKNT